jgi:hypothetical protein
MWKHTLIYVIVIFLGACKSNQHQINVAVTDEVINPNYIGNGVQWDAYPEAEIWGAAVSEDDWNKLYKRLDFMKPNYVRCMINSPFRYFDPETGAYDRTRNIEPLARLLQYCQDNNITVLFGEFNPPTWEMKDDPRWIAMAADYLNYLVNHLGFTCIKYYNLFNEPDGNWASTDGDFYLWKRMIYLFHEEMKKYPGLSDQVQIAGPDIVKDYNNPASPYKSYEWVDQTAKQMDDVIGLYDIHAYPGQHQVRSGDFAEAIKRYKQNVPAGKQIIFGEAGYKYWRTEDSLLMQEYEQRAQAHPLTKGSDSNMFVYDFFYGLDMPLLAMEIMNGGYSAIAAWMLDDAMHSQYDAGNTEDIKLWGMWNILGEEVFGMTEEEQIRPWFYSWSLMCRYFPNGTDIVKVDYDENPGVRIVSGKYQDKRTIALVNFSYEDYDVSLSLPEVMENSKMYVYIEPDKKKDSNGFPSPVHSDMEIGKDFSFTIKNQSFVLLTNIMY